MSNPIIVEQHGSSLVIRFNRPGQRNPLSVEVVDLLTEIVSEIDESIRKVIFTGTGSVFASGADLREVSPLDTDSAPAFARRGQKLMDRITSLLQTTIAAVNGPCYGGALDLALSCDRRIVSFGASFCHPGTGLGIMTGWGGTQRLPRLVGEANALEMFFTAAPIDANRAIRIGLIDEIADDPLARALELSQ